MKIEIEITGDNEGTDSPWWAIVDPRQNMGMELSAAAFQITGPFFSRAEAEHQLKATRYNYSKRANVWCFSGYHSYQYKMACREAEKAEREPKKTKRFVYLPEAVRGDHIFADTFAPAGVYEAHVNPQGAVSVKATNGKLLGVKPHEFVDAGGVIG